jgi:hypothetical protein
MLHAASDGIGGPFRSGDCGASHPPENDWRLRGDSIEDCEHGLQHYCIHRSVPSLLVCARRLHDSIQTWCSWLETWTKIVGLRRRQIHAFPPLHHIKTEQYPSTASERGRHEKSCWHSAVSIPNPYGDEGTYRSEIAYRHNTRDKNPGLQPSSSHLGTGQRQRQRQLERRRNGAKRTTHDGNVLC